jgi:hypothetical protein
MMHGQKTIKLLKLVLSEVLITIKKFTYGLKIMFTYCVSRDCSSRICTKREAKVISVSTHSEHCYLCVA